MNRYEIPQRLSGRCGVFLHKKPQKKDQNIPQEGLAF
jgi:hypothetical protein